MSKIEPCDQCGNEPVVVDEYCEYNSAFQVFSITVECPTHGQYQTPCPEHN